MDNDITTKTENRTELSFEDIVNELKDSTGNDNRPKDGYEDVIKSVESKTNLPVYMPIPGRAWLFKRIMLKFINFAITPRNIAQNEANRVLTNGIRSSMGHLRQQNARIAEQEKIIEGLNARIKTLEKMIDEQNGKNESIRVFQITPGLRRGDGVGNDVLAIHDFLKNEKKIDTKIFYFSCNGDFSEEDAQNIYALPATKDSDILMVHLAIYWEFLDKLENIPGRKIFVYHNITPYEFFEPYDANNAYACKKGIEQVRAINHIPEYCLADSEFNKNDLISYGYECPIDVLPIIIPFGDYDRKPDQATIERLSDGLTNILFVGRIAPNKKQEDIIKAFDYYQREFNPSSRLILLGGYDDNDLYYKSLAKYTEELGVKNVEFTRHVPFEQVVATISKADVFVCLSEHEGFCIPLLEAMHFEIPIVAYDTTAIKYTLGEGGILLKEKDEKTVAETIDKLVKQPELREDIKAKQRKRIEEVSYERITKMLWDYLTKFEPALKND